MAQVSGAIGDKLISAGGEHGSADADARVARKLRVRRLMFTVAFASPALGLAFIGFLTFSVALCIAVLSVAFSLNGFNVPAFLNIVDVAPIMSGTVMGMCNGFSATSGFLVPSFTAFVVGQDPSSAPNWRTVFFSGTAWYVVALSGFFVFGKSSAVILPGAQDEEDEEEANGDEEESPRERLLDVHDL